LKISEGALAVWSIIKSAVEGYIAHGALSRGAAIAFYVVTSLAPVLLIVVAVAGIVFGQDAVRGSLVQQLGGLFGQRGGELIQSMLASSSDEKSGATASVLGAIAVLVTASGVFSEMQTGLNQAWQVKAPDQPVLLMLRARAASLGLVAALGFLLMVSLAASTALAALGTYLDSLSSFAPVVLAALNTLISLGLFTLLFALALSPPRYYLRSASPLSVGISAQRPRVPGMGQPARSSSCCYGLTTAPRYFCSAPSLPGLSRVVRRSRRLRSIIANRARPDGGISGSSCEKRRAKSPTKCGAFPYSAVF
jgi:YihY family inner membrane protein